MRRPRRARPSSAGFTLVELSTTLVIFVVMGWVVGTALGLTRSTHEVLMDAVADNESLRRANAGLMDELKLTRESTLTVTTLGDGNHEATFMLPIGVGPNPAWGVPASSFGADPKAQDEPGWSLRYTVDSVPYGGGIKRRLVRQILNDIGVLQSEEVIVEGLRAGNDDPPGFTLVDAGNVWVVTLGTVGPTASSQGKGTEFHVRMRNPG